MFFLSHKSIIGTDPWLFPGHLQAGDNISPFAKSGTSRPEECREVFVGLRVLICEPESSVRGFEPRAGQMFCHFVALKNDMFSFSHNKPVKDI